MGYLCISKLYQGHQQTQKKEALLDAPLLTCRDDELKVCNMKLACDPTRTCFHARLVLYLEPAVATISILCNQVCYGLGGSSYYMQQYHQAVNAMKGLTLIRLLQATGNTPVNWFLLKPNSCNCASNVVQHY